jgi:hypothetical protein
MVKHIQSLKMCCFLSIIIITGCGGKSVPTAKPVSPSATLSPRSTDTPMHTVTPTITPTHEPFYISTATTIPDNSRPLILAHYMPWYQAPPIDSTWGWHWTMNHFNPDLKDENGNREIASHFHPLTGPYDSRDPALLEYQVLLMKLSGIDGVIVDWYGSENFWDYGVLNESTQALFEYINEASLLFSICYEDQTIRNMIDNNHLALDNARENAQKEMRYLESNWFREDVYLRVSERPVLFIFGPQYFKSAPDWEDLFSVLNITPVFITEDNMLPPVATSSYPWPPMWASQNGVLTEKVLKDYLTSFYKKTTDWSFWVASAFPGFYDIYKEAEVSSGYGYLDSRDGETFKETLQLALDNQPDAIQLVTWNDYGEGTNIEPTNEFGYKYLGIVQDAIRASINPDFTYTMDDLVIPFQIFQLRKQYEGNTEVNSLLDQAFQKVIAGDLESVKSILVKYPIEP